MAGSLVPRFWTTWTPQVQYLVGMAKNSVLEAATGAMRVARRVLRHAERDCDRVRPDSGTRRAAWQQDRRVIHKAEVWPCPVATAGQPAVRGDEHVAEMPSQVYDIYRQRGDSENRIKELKGESGSGSAQLSRVLGEPAAAAAVGGSVRDHAATARTAGEAWAWRPARWEPCACGC